MIGASGKAGPGSREPSLPRDPEDGIAVSALRVTIPRASGLGTPRRGHSSRVPPRGGAMLTLFGCPPTRSRGGTRLACPVTHPQNIAKVIFLRWRVSDRSLCSRSSGALFFGATIANGLRFAPAHTPFCFELLRGAAPRAGKASKHETPHPHASLSLTRRRTASRPSNK